MDDLLSKIYDKVIFQEADSVELDKAFDDMVNGLLKSLGDIMPQVDREKISDLVYDATYQARKDGFLLGARFMARLMEETLETPRRPDTVTAPTDLYS